MKTTRRRFLRLLGLGAVTPVAVVVAAKTPKAGVSPALGVAEDAPLPVWTDNTKWVIVSADDHVSGIPNHPR